jgi:hypothetical protein
MVTKKQAYNLAWGVALRAVRAFVAGFLATAATISITDVSSWTDLATALGNIALAGVIGGISAVIMASDKYLRAE